MNVNNAPLKKAQFVHGRICDGGGVMRMKGGITMFYEPQKDTEKATVSFALCSRKDAFCRATGRKHAKNVVPRKNGDVFLLVTPLLSWSELKQRGLELLTQYANLVSNTAHFDISFGEDQKNGVAKVLYNI